MPSNVDVVVNTDKSKLADDPDADADVHTSHCRNCVNVGRCEKSTSGREVDSSVTTLKPCPVIACPNNCAFRLHQCKLDEHLSATCPNETIECINRPNGCKFALKRADLAQHLLRCPANVVRCSSFSIRLIKNKSSSSQVYKKKTFKTIKLLLEKKKSSDFTSFLRKTKRITRHGQIQLKRKRLD